MRRKCHQLEEETELVTGICKGNQALPHILKNNNRVKMQPLVNEETALHAKLQSSFKFPSRSAFLSTTTKKEYKGNLQL